MGQLAIIFMVWPIFLLIRHKNTKAWQVSRLGIATSCVAVALFWTGERALSLVESLETRVATMIQTDPQELSRSATARSGKS
ncbi:hypothetical protein D9M70_447210 [compost metagenome]